MPNLRCYSHLSICCNCIWYFLCSYNDFPCCIWHPILHLIFSTTLIKQLYKPLWTCARGDANTLFFCSSGDVHLVLFICLGIYYRHTLDHCSTACTKVLRGKKKKKYTHIHTHTTRVTPLQPDHRPFQRHVLYYKPLNQSNVEIPYMVWIDLAFTRVHPRSLAFTRHHARNQHPADDHEYRHHDHHHIHA